jgi:hypothetical protein
MLTPEERDHLRNSRIARFYEMERQFYLVTALYPAQRLSIYVNSNEIVDILNCTHDDAVALINKIGIKEPDTDNWRIRTSVFCDHLDIDEMFVQVFLASLYLNDQPLPPKKILPALTREQIEAQRPGSILDKIKQLQAGFYENTITLAIRDQIYVEKNPLGEPMCKRIKWVQMVIRAFEVAQIYKCPIKTAQKMLREVKEDDREHYPGIKERRYVSIKRFCEVHGDDEADLRKHLAELHGETDDDDDD